MDFFEAQDRARRQTWLLVVYFIVAVILMIGSLYVAVIAALTFTAAKAEMAQPVDWFQPQQSEVMLDIDEWDTICLADVMYEDIFVQPVAKAVRNLLRQNRNSTVGVPANR